MKRNYKPRFVHLGGPDLTCDARVLTIRQIYERYAQTGEAPAPRSGNIRGTEEAPAKIVGSPDEGVAQILAGIPEEPKKPEEPKEPKEPTSPAGD